MNFTDAAYSTQDRAIVFYIVKWLHSAQFRSAEELDPLGCLPNGVLMEYHF